MQYIYSLYTVQGPIAPGSAALQPPISAALCGVHWRKVHTTHETQPLSGEQLCAVWP